AFAGLAQARLESNFLLSAGTQLGGGALADRLVGGQFLGELEVTGSDSLGCTLQRGDRALGRGRDTLATLDARAQPLSLDRPLALLARGALGHTALGRDLRLDPRSLDRGRPFVGGLAAP